jgi:2-oxo-4-hydroxy-4-carboxy-5-ureidoimidazoline decarboxylase
MNLDLFNRLSTDEAMKDLLRCCGSRRWAEQVASRRPFADSASVVTAADEAWWKLDAADWLEAFTHHPKIGDIDSLRAKFATTKEWAAGEQSGVNAAGEDVLRGLAEGNSDYEKKFGHIFIVCATGKSAQEMLTLLQERLKNSPDKELRIAAGEQAKITRIRLEKLLS